MRYCCAVGSHMHPAGSDNRYEIWEGAGGWGKLLLLRQHFILNHPIHEDAAEFCGFHLQG